MFCDPGSSCETMFENKKYLVTKTSFGLRDPPADWAALLSLSHSLSSAAVETEMDVSAELQSSK